MLRDRNLTSLAAGAGVCLAAAAFAVSLPATEPPIFQDCTSEMQLQLANSAACWADLDGDGWVDLCAGGVWLNQRGKRFTKLLDGVGSTVAADFDNDGDTDLFCWSTLKLYRHDGEKRFTLIDLPKLPKCVSRGACWGDFNGDGRVDLYIGGYEDWNAGITYPDMVLTNEGQEGFKLAWSETRYRARGVTACDFDQDADLDVYVSNYRLQPNILWVNHGAGSFQDETKQRHAVATTAPFGGGHSIGACWGDFDNDGAIDLFAGNFAHVDSRGDQPKSRFLRNLGRSKEFVFDDLGPCGIRYQESYASPSVGDFDNDGDLDLFFTTVYGTASFGRKNFPVLYRNDGQYKFADATEATGLAGLPPTYQSAWADFDRDGDLDLVAGGKLLRNNSRGRHWLEVRLQGDGRHVNRSAIGTQIRIQVGDQTLARQIEAGTGEGNQNDMVLHFGLGDHARAVQLEIFWPNGKMQEVDNVKVDRLITCQY